MIEERSRGDDVIIDTVKLGSPLHDGKSARPDINRSRFMLPYQFDQPYPPGCIPLAVGTFHFYHASDQFGNVETVAPSKARRIHPHALV